MTTERTKKVSGATRRSLLRGAAAIAASAGLVPFSRGAFAQDGQWWESIIGHGAQLDRRSREGPSESKTIRLDDLREGPTPWLSDVMVQSMHGAIERYQKIVANGGWPMVQGPRLMRPGDDDERVPALRRRLRASGDMPATGSYYDSYAFDGELEQAVMRFQARHGLRMRGRVDRPTFAALNVTAEMRLNQLRLNLNRVQQLWTSGVEDRYVFVNVPAYQLEAVEHHEVQQRHRVITGRQGRETPSIKSTIRGLNFYPYWRVPGSIARLDLVPRMQREPDYLEKEHIRAFRGSFDGPEIDLASIDWHNVDLSQTFFRQDPGPWNALGLVRIDMPNEHIVYMHDTPMKQLFKQPARSYSAGCVRVQDVMDLVSWIAKHEPGWEQPERVQAVIDQGDPLDLTLSRPIPVYFAYITAWGETNGEVQFRPDIYDRDGARELAGDIDPEDAPPAQPVNALAP